MASVVRAAMIFEYPSSVGNRCVMTSNWLDARSTPTSSADVDLIIDGLATWHNTGLNGETSLKTHQVTTCKLVAIQAQRFMAAPPDNTREKTYSVLGLDSAPGLPPTVCACISLRTGKAGRSYRGRMFLPGIPETTNSPLGTLLSAQQQAIADCAKGLLGGLPGLSASDVKLGVWSRKLEVGNDVTSIRVGSALDIQRRRRIKDQTYVTGA